MPMQRKRFTCLRSDIPSASGHKNFHRYRLTKVGLRNSVANYESVDRVKDGIQSDLRCLLKHQRSVSDPPVRPDQSGFDQSSALGTVAAFDNSLPPRAILKIPFDCLFESAGAIVRISVRRL